MTHIDDYLSDNDSYPTSVSGKKCIGPCYKANDIVIHPISKKSITSIKNFCPILPEYVSVNNKTKITEFDFCNFPTTYHNKKLNINSTNFDYRLLLKLLYNCDSLFDSVKYINNNALNVFSEIRIIDLSWNAFDNNIDNVPNIFYDYYKKKILAWKYFYVNSLFDIFTKYNYTNDFSKKTIENSFNNIVKSSNYTKSIKKLFKYHIHVVKLQDKSIISHFVSLKLNFIILILKQMNIIDLSIIDNIFRKLQNDFNSDIIGEIKI